MVVHKLFQTTVVHLDTPNKTLKKMRRQ